MRGEFDLIARCFAPLAAGAPGSLGLADDAAVLRPEPGEDLVLTLDTLIEGVHYLPNDPAGMVARKLLRVNLSDLAAMGARPVGYLLGTALAKPVDEAWVAEFAAGLQADQDRFELSLLGGDTTAGPGPTTLSLTALGAVPRGRALRRGGARVGDGIYVSSTIGDAALGLEVLNGQRAAASESDRAFLVERYRLPRPRLALGRALLEAELATAAIDVSDGLVADLEHVCTASGLGAAVAVAQAPLSAAVQRLAETDGAVQVRALTGGDDYELLFTVPEGREDEVARLAERLNLPLTRIGRMTEGEGVELRDAEGRRVDLAQKGWTHF